MLVVPLELVWYEWYRPMRLVIKAWIARVLVGTPQRTMCWYVNTDRYVPTKQILETGPVLTMMNLAIDYTHLLYFALLRFLTYNANDVKISTKYSSSNQHILTFMCKSYNIVLNYFFLAG